jgi:hypothetical protein
MGSCNFTAKLEISKMEIFVRGTNVYVGDNKIVE